MDNRGDDNCFKHIPFRLYDSDKPLQQRLIKPLMKSEEDERSKRLTTLKDLLEEMVPDKPCDESKDIYKILEVAFVGEMNEKTIKSIGILQHSLVKTSKRVATIFLLHKRFSYIQNHIKCSRPLCSLPGLQGHKTTSHYYFTF